VGQRRRCCCRHRLHVPGGPSGGARGQLAVVPTRVPHRFRAIGVNHSGSTCAVVGTHARGSGGVHTLLRPNLRFLLILSLLPFLLHCLILPSSAAHVQLGGVHTEVRIRGGVKAKVPNHQGKHVPVDVGCHLRHAPHAAENRAGRAGDGERVSAVHAAVRCTAHPEAAKV
jgi:hypothetical protein